ncbi:MAG: metallophosphoesterase family protein [Nitrospinaceae bacterium]
MKYIIFSDVHSNLESLNAFSRIAETIDHDKKVCLGDSVGYGADPNPCVEWIRDHADLVLAGNHDYAALELTDTTYFNSYAFESCLWTQEELTEENKRFLASLPVEKEEDGVYWVHSSPFEPREWHYVRSLSDGEENFACFDQPLCFLGHSHLPLIIEKNPEGEICCYMAQKMELEDGYRYIINVGSLGQPRDGDPNPCFVIYDSEAKIVEFRRFSYDFSLTQQKILENDLPEPLALRLSYGR